MGPGRGKFNGGGSRLSGIQVVGVDLLVPHVRSRFRSPQRHQPVNRAPGQVLVDFITDSKVLFTGSSDFILGVSTPQVEESSALLP